MKSNSVKVTEEISGKMPQVFSTRFCRNLAEVFCRN